VRLEIGISREEARGRGGGSVRWMDRANMVGGPQQTPCQNVIGFDDQREVSIGNR
jgi:hypothetical protein